MKKSVKIILGTLVVLALIGLCFLCVAVYAKKEINKPTFELPELNEQTVSALPDDKAEAFDYVSRLYESAVSSDDVELSQHTDIHTTEGEKALPFSEADNGVISRILEKSQGSISSLYPKYENVLAPQAESVPDLGFTVDDVIDFTANKGRIDENGITVEEDYYFITLKVNSECIDVNEMLESDVRKNIEKELSSILSISSLEIEPEGFETSFKVRYSDDLLTHVEIKRRVRIRASVDFTAQDYKMLSDKTVQLEFPYETVNVIDLFHYGARFTERQIAVQKSDMQALPLEVRVNSGAEKKDYKLNFKVSDDGFLKIDEDGVMTVTDTREAPLKVTAELEYDGHKYTDALIVYATELEVKTDEPTGN